MRLPDAGHARVDREKIVDYLLSFAHPDGRAKAEFFSRFGFNPNEWEVLADVLREMARTCPVTQSTGSPWGVRYTVDGPLRSPDGRNPQVRTIWIAEAGIRGPRLITAYPRPDGDV